MLTMKDGTFGWYIQWIGGLWWLSGHSCLAMEKQGCKGISLLCFAWTQEVLIDPFSGHCKKVFCGLHLPSLAFLVVVQISFLANLSWSPLVYFSFSLESWLQSKCSQHCHMKPTCMQNINMCLVIKNKPPKQLTLSLHGPHEPDTVILCFSWLFSCNFLI